jgi:phage shock protein PspC (stress-responsive transcriptional regulator)
MDKTMKINLAGMLFQIDSDAYQILRDYLQALTSHFRNIPGGNETLDDIESRIAEIFQSEKGLSDTVSKENVEAMIVIIGKPEDIGHNEDPSESKVYNTNRRRLYRNPEDTIISGVAGGIGAYLNINPVWIRVLFILFTIFYGIGFFVYIALWIALPSANTDSKKMELYGGNYNTRPARRAKEPDNSSRSTALSGDGNQKVSNVENALNEIFRAIGNFFFIVFRILVIVIGVCFVLIGFSLLLAFIMAFFFNYTGFFEIDSFNASVLYLPDFLNLLFNPSVTPWIIGLLFIIVTLPLIAIIYWGLKMIFWFQVKDMVISLVALVLWVLSISALVLLLFSQGISFAETGRKNEQVIIEQKSDTLYLVAGRKIADLKFEKEISLPGAEYSLYINRKDNELYGRPHIRLYDSEDRTTRIEVNRHSNGKTRKEAVEKAESLMYNYKISNDSIYLDQYYSIPSKNKWAGADINIELFLPKGKVIRVDKNSADLFHDYVSNGIHSWDLGDKYWIWTEEGLEEIIHNKSK